MKTISEVQEASDDELLAFYNEHNPQKQFMRINNRPQFETWCMELIVELAEEEGGVECEPVKAPINALQAMVSIKAFAEAEHVPPKPSLKRSNSEGVAASWTDNSVAAARLVRDGVRVEVDGKATSHKSCRDAFRAHKLPDSKHIRFRVKLKASRKEVFEHDGKRYYFSIE